MKNSKTILVIVLVSFAVVAQIGFEHYRKSPEFLAQLPVGFTVSATPSLTLPGGQLTVRWTAPLSRSPYTEIILRYNLFPVSAPFWRNYLPANATSGVFSVTVPSQPQGMYEFRIQYFSQTLAVSNQVNVTTATPIVRISANPTLINPGIESTLNWTAQNAESCAAQGGWNGSKPTTGNETVRPHITAVYTLLCVGVSGSEGLWSTAVRVNGPGQSSKRINNDGWPDSPYIWSSADGKILRLYYMYSRWRFPFGVRITPVITGPVLKNLHTSNNPWDEADIYVAESRDGGEMWSAPEPLGFNGPLSDCCATPSDDERIVIYNTYVTPQNHQDLYTTARLSNNTWSAPYNLGPSVNTQYNEFNPHVVGNTIYFTSDRPGGRGGNDIYYSEYIGAWPNGSWTAPVNMAFINTAQVEDTMWVNQAKTKGYFSREAYIFEVDLVDAGRRAINDGRLVDLGLWPVSEPTLTRDEQKLFFEYLNPKKGKGEIWYSKRRADGSWAKAKPVD